jgi:phage gp36-like protein
MAYCALADIQKLLPELELAELTAESGTTPDSAIVTEAIAKADAEIDSYLGVKYAVPLASVPDRLRSLSEDISIYYLYVRRSVVPEPREKAYQNAIAFLREAVKGNVVLMDGNSEAPVAERHTPEFSYTVRVFSRALMTDF